jgi:hypothetical protein
VAGRWRRAVGDLPECWLRLDRTVTVDVEAKAKELAVLDLQRELDARLARPPRARRAASR